MIVGRMVRLLVAMLAVLVMMGIRQQMTQSRESVVYAATIPGMQKPSPAPIGMLGLYLNTGFNLQPADVYTSVGHEKMLSTGTAHSVLDLLYLYATDHFQWAQSEDEGVNWKDMPGKDGANLMVTPEKVGTVYYQQRFKYYHIISTWPQVVTIPIVPTTYYSRVAAITTFPAPISATDLTATADNNYLYNNQKDAQQTYVHATPTPVNATGDLIWSSSDTSLATVSEHTGEVTANISGETGVVKIKGTLTNSDGTSVAAEVPITIGGGLDSQTVDEGQTATFTVRGKFDQTPENITWYRVDNQGHSAKINGQSGLSYTTPASTQADNQQHYYAVVTIKDADGKLHPITTNQALLTVIPDPTPKVTVTNTVENLSTNSKPSTTLDNVHYNDICQITGTVTDTNAASKLDDGDFSINLPKDADGILVEVDGKPAGYKTTDNGAQKNYLATGQSFKDEKTHTFSVSFINHQKQNLRYSTGVTLQGYADKSRSQSLGTFTGNDVQLNFTDGKLKAVANDVDFGHLTMQNLGQNLPGKAAGDGELLDITDNRQNKAATRIDLRQSAPLNNGQANLAATMSFDPGSKQALLPLSTADQTLVTTKAGDTLSSIGGAQGQGLTIKVNTGDFQPGTTYTTQLIWSIVTGP